MVLEGSNGSVEVYSGWWESRGEVNSPPADSGGRSPQAVGPLVEHREEPRPTRFRELGSRLAGCGEHMQQQLRGDRHISAFYLQRSTIEVQSNGASCDRGVHGGSSIACDSKFLSRPNSRKL